MFTLHDRSAFKNSPERIEKYERAKQESESDESDENMWCSVVAVSFNKHTLDDITCFKQGELSPSLYDLAHTQ